MPTPQQIFKSDIHGATRLVWVGHIVKGTVVSGPPYYVFDANGNLVEWAAQKGDSGLDQRPYWLDSQSQSMTLKQALDFVAGESTDRPEQPPKNSD